MKLPKQKIESAAAKNHARQYLTGVYLDAEARLLVASDGHAMTTIKVETAPGDVSGVIPVEAIKYARKNGIEELLTTNDNGSQEGRLVAIVGDEEFDLIGGHYPEIDNVVPEPSEVTIALDLTLLDRIRKSLFASSGPSSTCQVKLMIRSNNDCVRVEPIYGQLDSNPPSAVSILAPVRA